MSSSRKYPYLASAIVLFTVIGYSSTDFYLFWHQLDQHNNPNSVVPFHGEQDLSGLSVRISEEDLLNFPLFRLYDESLQKPVQNKPIPKAKMKLGLEAIYFASSQARSAAQITTPDGSQLYRVGDMVGGQMLVKAINEYSVTLEVNGTLENLAFSQDVGNYTTVDDKRPLPPDPALADARSAASDQHEIAEKLEALRQRFGSNAQQ